MEQFSFVVTLMPWILASFALLKAISTFLDFVAAKTASVTDDKIAAGLSKCCRFFQQVVDLFIGNTRS